MIYRRVEKNRRRDDSKKGRSSGKRKRRKEYLEYSSESSSEDSDEEVPLERIIAEVKKQLKKGKKDKKDKNRRKRAKYSRSRSRSKGRSRTRSRSRGRKRSTSSSRSSSEGKDFNQATASSQKNNSMQKAKSASDTSIYAPAVAKDVNSPTLDNRKNFHLINDEHAEFITDFIKRIRISDRESSSSENRGRLHSVVQKPKSDEEIRLEKREEADAQVLKAEQYKAKLVPQGESVQSVNIINTPKQGFELPPQQNQYRPG